MEFIHIVSETVSEFRNKNFRYNEREIGRKVQHATKEIRSIGENKQLRVAKYQVSEVTG